MNRVAIEKVAYKGWPNCVRLANDTVELIVTLDVGPRILRFGFIGGQNLFKNFEEQMGLTAGNEWRSYGGHRLWHAPEVMPRTYYADNDPVEHAWDGAALKLLPPVERTTVLQKEIEILLAPTGGGVIVNHRLINRGCWDVEVAPWVLSVMDAAGRAIVPQEDFGPHPQFLAPARPVVLWKFTNMADPRWTWGERYIQLRHDAHGVKPQKVGLLNTKGWAAYTLRGEVFIKKYGYDPTARYADLGCNTELFTNGTMLELETLGPLSRIAPNGGVGHIERWGLFKADIGADERAIDRTLLPLVRQVEDV
jgi:hypothetical protein